MGLIELLKEKQGSSTDEKFSQKLKISRPMWTRIKLGDVKAGTKVLSGVLAAYPSMRGAVINYLKEEVN